MPTYTPDVVSDFRFYRVHPDAPTTGRVLVGEGQAGGTVLHWAGGTASFPGEDRDPHAVGEGQSLVDTFLDVTTTVKDIRPETNRTSIEVHLDGGVEPAVFPYAWDVGQDQGVVVYAIEFFLVA